MAEVTTRTLARNTLAVNAGQLWQVLSRFVLTPLVLAKIGLEGYGTWALLFGLTSTVSMLQTSFGTAYGKITAERERREDWDGLAEAVTSGMLSVGAAGAAGFLALWALAPWYLPWLGVPVGDVEGAARALALVGAGIVLEMSLGGALRVLEGLQRTDLRVRIQVEGSVVDFAVALGLLYAGWGLLALATGFLVGRVFQVLGAWARLRRVASPLVRARWRPSRQGLRAVASLGMRFQALALLNMLARQAVRLTLSALGGVAVLGTYHLAFRLLSLARTPAQSVVAPLLPAFARLESGGDRERWSALLRRSTKALAVAAIAALGFTALFAEPLLYAWTERHVPDAVFTVQVMAGASVLALLTGVFTAALRASGTVRLELVYGAVGAAGSLLGLAVGHALAGYRGAVVGLAAARVLAVAWFLLRFAEARGVGLGRLMGPSVALPAVGLAPVLAAVVLAGTHLPFLVLQGESRIAIAASLAALAALCAAASAAVAWIGLLSAEERAGLRRELPLLRRRAAASP